MSKATKVEILSRYLNKFLTVEEFNDPIKSKRLREAFWAGSRAHYKVMKNKEKAEKRKP